MNMDSQKRAIIPIGGAETSAGDRNPTFSQWLSKMTPTGHVTDDPKEISYLQYLAHIRIARVEAFAESVMQRLKELPTPKSRGGLEFDYVDFVRRLAAADHEVNGGADDVKLEYLQRYLTSCINAFHVDVTWKDLFLRYLRLCTGCHLTVLTQFFQVQKDLDDGDRFGLSQPTDTAPITLPHLQRLLPTRFDPSLIHAVISDLAAFGLIRFWGYVGKPGFLGKSESGWSITDNGVLFLRFVNEQSGHTK